MLFGTSRMFTLVIAITMGLMTRQRMSHNNGIAARGTFTVGPDPALPRHSFWEPGKVFPCRIRHAAATFYDDAMSAIRSCSFKLSDEEWDSPFDLELNTGSITLFWNAMSFLKLAKMRKERYGVEYGEYYKNYPVAKDAARRTLRRDPKTFADLTYYNKTPLLWEADDGTRYYAKYRIVPAGEIDAAARGRVEVGSPQWVEPENQRIDPTTNPHTRNYLKEEYQHRVQHRSVRGESVDYRLQVQLREHRDDQDEQVYNCCIDWPTGEFPWRDLGTFRITETLGWADGLRTTFSMSNLPRRLGVLPARSIYDFNSLNYMRKHIDLAKRARLLAYKIKGIPPEIPNDSFRNSSYFIDKSRPR